LRHDWDGARVQLQVHSIETSQALGIDEDHVDAYANIARRVARHRGLRHRARAGDRRVRRGGRLPAGRVGGRTTRRRRADPESREVIATLLRRSEQADRKAQRQARKAQRAAARGPERVRQAHGDMLRNVDRLDANQVQDLLRAAADDLKSTKWPQTGPPCVLLN